MGVFGGTGRVGSQLVRQMLRDGRRLRLVLRSPEKATKMFGDTDDIDRIPGNYLKLTSSEIGKAIRGSESVVICSAANPAASVNFIRLAAALCADQKVRLVYLSSWGSQYPWNPVVAGVNAFLSNPFKYHLEKERVIRGPSGLDYTIVRPTNFSASP